MKKFLKYLVIPLLLAGGGFFLFNMKEGKIIENGFTVAFYNVENLYDTINDPHVNDDEFLPRGKNKWSSARYHEKLSRLGEVIGQLGDKDGPEIVGICEIENSTVINDLIHTAELSNRGYKFIHFNSKDRRGIDVALIYKENSFSPIVKKAYSIPSHNENQRTRDILLVSGKVGADTFYFLVNHWPSRRKGKEESEKQRIEAAQKLRQLVDSLLAINKYRKIILMGDFNDEPRDKSIHSVLGAGNGDSKEILYNPFLKLQDDGVGTIRFERQWDLFDQIIISDAVRKKGVYKYVKGTEHVFDPIWMYYREDKNSGPFRTYSGSKYNGGYSDHFPVYIQLSK